jgi:hypothetical protein
VGTAPRGKGTFGGQNARLPGEGESEGWEMMPQFSFMGTVAIWGVSVGLALVFKKANKGKQMGGVLIIGAMFCIMFAMALTRNAMGLASPGAFLVFPVCIWIMRAMSKEERIAAEAREEETEKMIQARNMEALRQREARKAEVK